MVIDDRDIVDALLFRMFAQGGLLPPSLVHSKK